MTFASVAQANSKTAEFARLFDLFDRVATRRTRALNGDTREVISAEDLANVPAEFAPVLRNLSMVLSLRTRRNQVHVPPARPASTTRTCHNTPASRALVTEKQMPRADAIGLADQAEEDTDSPAFPPGERYPFTFKLMLHKLYDLDEWAEKVKDAVEASKSQFKPLAECLQNVVMDVAMRGEKRNSGHYPVLGASAKFKPPTRHLYTPSSTAISAHAAMSPKERGDKRSGVRPDLGTSIKFKPPSRQRHEYVAVTHPIPVPKPEVSRVLKKRCIGRRKSVHGPLSAAVWVYDAAISATETPGARPAVEITLSPRRDVPSAVEGRARHRSLATLEEAQIRDTKRRKIKITVPLLQEKAIESVLSKPSLALPDFLETESVVKRKRSVASVFASESCKKITVKGPLCV